MHLGLCVQFGYGKTNTPTPWFPSERVVPHPGERGDRGSTGVSHEGVGEKNQQEPSLWLPLEGVGEAVSAHLPPLGFTSLDEGGGSGTRGIGANYLGPDPGSQTRARG